LKSKISIKNISTFLSSSSKSSQALTISRAFFHLIFKAEYFGGNCEIFQVNLVFKISCINSFFKFFLKYSCFSSDKYEISVSLSKLGVVQFREILNS